MNGNQLLDYVRLSSGGGVKEVLYMYVFRRNHIEKSRDPVEGPGRGWAGQGRAGQRQSANLFDS